MGNGKSYTQHLIDLKEDIGKIKSDVASIKTTNEYQENHLRNIDSHLEKQNSRIDKSEQRLDILETERDTERRIENPINSPSAFMKLVNKGKTPGLVIGIAGLIFTGIYSLGQVMGWW